MAMYQRRMASSIFALKESLRRRQKKLKEQLESADALTEAPLPDLPAEEDWEEMDAHTREELESKLERVTIARHKSDLAAEIKEIERLLELAERISGQEIKLRPQRPQLTEQGVFSNQDIRLLIFTEYKDTLKYLVEQMRQWGLHVGFIHGGMKPGSRDEPGTRLYAEREFWELKTQVLAATEAAGEGINLQRTLQLRHPLEPEPA